MSKAVSIVVSFGSRGKKKKKKKAQGIGSTFLNQATQVQNS